MNEHAETGVPPQNEAVWYQIFAEGHPVLASKQRRYGLLPGDPRCCLCHAPLGGVGGWLLKFRGLRSSERNPNFCTACDGFLNAFPGGAEVPMSMLLVDIRGSSALSESLPPAEFARLVIAMRNDIHEILVRTRGFILEYQGDSVLAVWPPGFVGSQHAANALEAAEQTAALQAQRGQGKVEVGAGVHSGQIFIGTVPDAGGRMRGIGAFGRDVNLVARLAQTARPGEVLVSTDTFAAAGRGVENGRSVALSLKGIEQPVETVVLGQKAAAPVEQIH